MVEGLEITQNEQMAILKNKTDEFFKIFCFHYNGQKRFWLLNYFFKHFDVLYNKVNIKLLLRYLLFGPIKR
ncbi:hypothetical protein, partial [Hydrotalea sp.]|uniref:hypothetical protein n=1 Tax=Hydrotalea sp. TaxID=2881279 RepID=UPI003D0A23E2